MVFKKGQESWCKGTKGIIKPNSRSFKKGQCKGFKNPHWKGGKIINDKGYIYIFQPNHPSCNGIGYIAEHRLIIEKYLGRYLKSKERVHHINNNKIDNRIENFIVFKNCGYHSVFHRWGYYNPKYIIFDGRKIK